MVQENENKIVKKSKTTIKWITCLESKTLSRVLYLLELFPNGLFQRDIFSLLNSPNDAVVVTALKTLEKTKFISARKELAKSIKAINDTTGNFEKIEYGLEAKRKRYFLNGTPIENFFNEAIKAHPKREKELTLLKEVISYNWKNHLKVVSFESEYFTTHSEEKEKQTVSDFKKFSEKLERLGNYEDALYFRKEADELPKTGETEKETKARIQKHEIVKIRNKQFTYVEIISENLQEQLLSLLIDKYKKLDAGEKIELEDSVVPTIEGLLIVLHSKNNDFENHEHPTMLKIVFEKLHNFKQEIKLKEAKELLQKSEM